MVKEIQMYEDAAGNTHRDKRDALRADLAIMLGSTGTINEASAKLLVDWLVDDTGERLDALRAALDDLNGAIYPPTPVGIADVYRMPGAAQ